MNPFQKRNLSDTGLDGILNIQTDLVHCTAQAIMATLMLHHPDSATMGQVLRDLSHQPDWWDAFVMGPPLPTTDQAADPAALVCLRDLGVEWNTNTLYVLARSHQSARSLKTLAQTWNCTQTAILPTQLTAHLLGRRRRQSLVIAYWQQRSRFMTEEIDFATAYDLTQPPQFDQLPQLGECSPQLLMAGLLLRHSSQRVCAPTILQDLQTHWQWWYSFVWGPALPNAETGLANRLQVLCGLPNVWSGDCLYLWARNRHAAIGLQNLSQSWACKTATILDSPETARLLAIPKGPLVVMVSW